MNGRRCTVIIHPSEPGRNAHACRRSAPRRDGVDLLTSRQGSVEEPFSEYILFIAKRADRRQGEGRRSPAARPKRRLIRIQPPVQSFYCGRTRVDSRKGGKSGRNVMRPGCSVGRQLDDQVEQAPFLVRPFRARKPNCAKHLNGRICANNVLECLTPSPASHPPPRSGFLPVLFAGSPPDRRGTRRVRRSPPGPTARSAPARECCRSATG